MISGPALAATIVASLIAAIGLGAIALAVVRQSPRDRSPLWFGLFACLYGVRLAGQSELVWAVVPVPAPDLFWRYLDAFITYSILVPVGLLAESVLGSGWRLILRRVWQAAAVYAALAIANDLTRQQPGATLWLNIPAVMISCSVAAVQLMRRLRDKQWSREFRVVAGGALVFFAVATYATLGGQIHLLEPVAMLVFTMSVGYFMAQRALASERRLVAVSRELDLAREIQQSILPQTIPDIAGLRVAARCLPMSEVAGDFYDFDAQHAASLGVIVADVSGHGVPAALVASMVKMAFAAEAARLDTPDLALESINRMLCGRFAGAYVTACCAFIDPVRHRLRYANAGHPRPLLRRADGRVERLDEGGLVLAFDASAQYVAGDVAIGPGDRAIFFSDGLLEAANARDEFFGDARLGQIVVARDLATPDQFVEALIAELRTWLGSDTHLQDDVTVVVVDVDG